MSKVLYLIGSLRNKRIPELAKKLRSKFPEVEVFDDWYAAGEEADDYWKEYERQRGRSYLQALEGRAARNVFRFDTENLNRATHALLVLPAGKSGHMEVMFAHYSVGAKSAILLDPEDVRWDVMYQFIPTILNNDEEIGDWLMTEEEFWGRPKEGEKNDGAEVRRRKTPDGPTPNRPDGGDSGSLDLRGGQIRRSQLAWRF